MNIVDVEHCTTLFSLVSFLTKGVFETEFE
jgi:hypothetical protein